ncbi:MAG TPA: AbrB/MazE/SpoVT family DNA-binding domain-containing protein [archaeon]|nr:AbrB/MazE/SpoVT family DNA-binding domain-containing protein [archaeon]
MILKLVKVSDKGQIAIPADVREQSGIEAGDQLFLIEEGGKIMLEKPSVIQKNVKDDFKNLFRISEQSLKKLWLNKADDIWDEYLKS